MLKIFFLTSLIVCSWIEAAASLSFVKVIDGDTIHAQHNGDKIKIRLVEIDAPEMDQPFGPQSKNFLNQLLSKKNVTLISLGEDRYGRILGEIYADGESVNTLMIKSGSAWVYDRYVKDSSLYNYQDRARAKSLGLWQAKDPIAPWVWRKQK